jgi:hypothetical protein
MRKGLFWPSDKQWARIAPHLPTNLTGPERDDDRRIISGIVHMFQSGARWRDLRDRPPRLRGLCRELLLLFYRPAPPALDRRHHLDPGHRAMHKVTLRTALRPFSPTKTGQPPRDAYTDPNQCLDRLTGNEPLPKCAKTSGHNRPN